jgi:dihydroflavonol-4-reductase
MAQVDKPKNVLVTGATGFVGSNLVSALIHKGYSVTCLVRNASSSPMLKKFPVHLIVGDLDNPGAIREARQEYQAVFHLAGAIKAASREQYFHINQLGTRRLLETLAEANPGLNRFIHISSLAAVGPSQNGKKLIEESEPHPISWYGESKLAAEQEVLHFARTFPVTILRPSAVYGPNDSEIFMIFRMIKFGCLVTPGHATRRFSLIHVDDLAAGIIQAGESNLPSGEIFFLSRPEAYTWEDVGQAIARSLGKSYRQIALPQWMATAAGIAGDFWAHGTGRPATLNSQKVRELLEPSWLCDSSKAQSRFGFTPSIDLGSGIPQTVRWYQNQGWL